MKIIEIIRSHASGSLRGSVEQGSFREIFFVPICHVIMSGEFLVSIRRGGVPRGRRRSSFRIYQSKPFLIIIFRARPLCSIFSRKNNYDDHPPQGLFEARRGRKFFKSFYKIRPTTFLNRRGGVPSGAAAFIISDITIKTLSVYKGKAMLIPAGNQAGEPDSRWRPRSHILNRSEDILRHG